MNDIEQLVAAQKEFYKSGITKNVNYRLHSLRQLKRAIVANEAAIQAALKEDLNKSDFEGYATEIGIVLEELSLAIRKLRGWAAPKLVPTPLAHFPSVSRIYKEPYGCVLIMSPWNYPFQLAMAPLVGAMAAGNCCVVKPSAYSAATTAVIARIVAQLYEPCYVAVVEGGRQANQSLLKQHFDYIFFTGSVAVGKEVMRAASAFLTPVSLELGGKSPCIVDETANLDLAARRIVWGKFVNAGQTCVAPDYVLVHRSVKAALLQGMEKYIHRFYGQTPATNDQYPKIINQKHYERLAALLQQGNLVCGGHCNPATRQIAPTIIDGVGWDDAVMQEEIFGPLLPVLEFEKLDEVVEQVSARPKPLALYYFATSCRREQYILKHLSFGGGCINDTIVHFATAHMPFGGVGDSGMGSYHGKKSFDTFTHEKGILKKSNLIDVPLRYPPNSPAALAIVKRLMK